MDIDTDIDNSVSPDTFRDKITILQAKLTPILDDFEKYYVYKLRNASKIFIK